MPDNQNFGDEEFEDFIRRQGPEESNSSLPFFLIFSLREKQEGILKMYKRTLKHLFNFPADSVMRKKLESFASELMKMFKELNQQFDSIMIEVLTEDDDE